MTIETRPAIYFPSMTIAELINYAESYSATELENALLEAMKDFADEHGALDVREAELDDRESKLDTLQDSLEERERDLDAREADLDEKE